jgi:glutamate dehydrogenase (NAD(P)+)
MQHRGPGRLRARTGHLDDLEDRVGRFAVSAVPRAASRSTRRNTRNGELERITRRFTYALGDNIGPDLDIPAPDVNTNAQIMAWIADTYSSTKSPSTRFANLHVVTGKPLGAGGLEGRDRATGFGVVATLKILGRAVATVSLKGMRYIVQGFGNVGLLDRPFPAEREGGHPGGCAGRWRHATTSLPASSPEALQRRTVPPTAVTSPDSPGAADYRSATTSSAIECEIVVPAALGNQITACQRRNHHRTRWWPKVPMGPTDTEGEAILRARMGWTSSRISSAIQRRGYR